MGGRLILVSNRLPVRILRTADGLVLDRSIGGVATALDAVFQKYAGLWVGWTGLKEEISEEALQALQLPKNLVPVQADKQLVGRYYDTMSNSVLWPSFHNIEPRYQPTESDWASLREIAERFAAAIHHHARPDDTIWVHDYHLILLPAALRKLGITNRIGFFWHTTFPSPPFLERLGHHRELLDSLGHLDLLGLQAERDVRNFHESAAELGMSKLPGAVKALPIGINFAPYHAAVRKPAVRELARAIRKKYAKKRMILSIARMDYTKGIPTQLRAVARFFEGLKPAERRKFIYKLVAAPSREGAVGYRELSRKIAKLVDEINAKFAQGTWKPIEYSFQNFSFEDMAAWYRAAEVLLLLPNNDGMNLIAKEFVATQRSGCSVLVLSNTTGAAAQLADALLVNPRDPEAAAAALSQAFAMPHQERAARWQRMLAAVRDQDVFWWAERFLGLLEGARP